MCGKTTQQWTQKLRRHEKRGRKATCFLRKNKILGDATLEPPHKGVIAPLRARCNIEDTKSSHAKNITHTQHSPTCCFLCIQGVTWLHSQQSRATMPMDPLHQENFSVITSFVNESATFFKVSTFNNNTLFSSTMSLTK
jgi:hypothetical protein